MEYHEMFPGFSKESIQFWCSVGNIQIKINFYVDHIHLLISIFGIILGFLHLTVLTRKSMRALTVNAFLAEIAVAELVRMICILVIIIPYFNLRYLRSDDSSECTSPTSAAFIENISRATYRTLEQLSIWIGVIMAIIRALVIKFPIRARIASLIHSKNGIYILILTTILILPIWIPHYSQELVMEPGRWIPLSNCRSFSENATTALIIFEETTLFGNTEVYLFSYVIDGIVFQLLPSIILPFATILLVYYLRKTKKASLSTKSLSRDKDSIRSIKLVTFMTFSYLITTTPQGIVYVLSPFLMKVPGILIIYSKFCALMVFLTTVNGIFHFSIYYFMSSRYRKIAAELLIKRNNYTLTRFTRKF